MRAIGALLVVAAFLARPGVARGEDSQADSLTVLPWSTASLVVSSKDTRAVVQLSDTTDCGWRWTGSVSAPLDGDSRVAAFTNNRELVSGFKATFQAGLDTDRKELLRQKAFLHKLRSLAEKLNQAATYSTALASFSKAKNLKLYTGGDFMRYMVDRCTEEGKSPCDVESLSRSVSQLSSRCEAGSQDPALEEQCLLEKTVRYQNGGRVDYQELVELVEDAPDFGELPPTLQGKRGTVSDVQLISENVPAMITFVDAQLKELESMERGLAMTTRPARNRAGHVILGDLAFSFDTKSVYEDLSMEAKKTTAYDLVAGFDYSYLPTVAGLSVNLRGGVEHSRGSGAEEVERCVTIASDDATVSGKECKDVLFRDEAQPDSETTGYARAAITYQLHGKLNDGEVLPGIEGRFGIDGLWGKRTANVRFSLFATPLKGDTAGRFGLAIDASYDVDRDAMESGTPLTITSLVFVGASFKDLLGKP